MERRSNQKIVNIRREKAIPAMAAAFGVFRRAWVRVASSGIAIGPCRVGTVDVLSSGLSLPGAVARRYPLRAGHLFGNYSRRHG
jgi:hypothetical protein